MTNTLNKCIYLSSIREAAEYGIKKAVVALGVFDGVHLGHQKLIGELLKMAAETNAVPLVFTFIPHPREIIRPYEAPSIIMPHGKKLETLAKYGAQAVVTLDFDRELAELSPEDFLRNYVFTSEVEIKGLCVGRNFKFGRHGGAGVAFLEEFSKKENFKFKALDQFSIDGIPVSSTAIRELIAKTELSEAAKLLGRPYTLYGRVISGYKLAGTKLDCPTANLEVAQDIICQRGIYAAFAKAASELHCKAVAVIGVSPTFKELTGNESVRIEAHLIDFSGDIYGKNIELELVEFIRKELFFSSVEALKTQINADLKKVNEILEGVSL